MQIRAGDWAVMSGRPILFINGFGEAEIEGELRDDLPAQAEICATAETIRSRNGKGVQHVVLVDINAVRPIASIKSLKTDVEA